MSKIYEALVRAEQERAELEKNQPPSRTLPPSDAPKPMTSMSGMPQAATTPVMPAMYEQPSNFAAPMQEPVEATVMKPTFSLDDVKPTIWRPMLTHLPALQERGRVLEQFRSLRSHMVEFRDLSTLKSILVASGIPQEGKSFVAANLAISFARHKASRVLLIDGDMRRSSLHHSLGCLNDLSLAMYLSGKASLASIMQRFEADPDGNTYPGLNSLTFISGGSDGDHAADLSGNPRFREMLEILAPHFDWIVLDSSPVNLVSDGVNLARACDGVLLVARGGVTKLETAQRALNELKASKVLGVVLNAVSDLPSTSEYYGYDTYDTYDSYDPIHKE
ncbi:MAG: CpsD/CapB family tyrosine-protein kinase [Acidobacteriota bacterium]